MTTPGLTAQSRVETLFLEVLKQQQGEAFVEMFQVVCDMSKQVCQTSQTNNKTLDSINSFAGYIKKFDSEVQYLLTKACSCYLYLLNISEQTGLSDEFSLAKQNPIWVEVSKRLGESVNKEHCLSVLEKFKLGVVLTMHPTEARTRLLREHLSAIQEYLAKNNWQGVERCIRELWSSHLVSDKSPSPLDEVDYVLSVVKHSFWPVIPNLYTQFAPNLPLKTQIVFLRSWAGGDRDGNPLVTSEVTLLAVLKSRLAALRLYKNTVNDIMEIKTNLTQDNLFASLLEKINNTQSWLEHCQTQKKWLEPPKLKARGSVLIEKADLYQSVLEILNLNKLDETDKLKIDNLLRQINTFGMMLSPIDIRVNKQEQDSLFSKITARLGLGEYESWPEDKRCEFWLDYLRAAESDDSATSIQIKQILSELCAQPELECDLAGLFLLLAQLPVTSFGSYIVSMTHYASDILGPFVLQRLLHNSDSPTKKTNNFLKIVPLFETKAALMRAPEIMKILFKQKIYIQSNNEEQESHVRLLRFCQRNRIICIPLAFICVTK